MLQAAPGRTADGTLQESLVPRQAVQGPGLPLHPRQRPQSSGRDPRERRERRRRQVRGPGTAGGVNVVG